MKEWIASTSLIKLHSFLGLANYYRWFIEEFLRRATPLIELLKKGTTWRWPVECQTVFDDLKVTMTRGPVHGLVDVSKPFIVEIDTSDFTLGSILTQEGHPIAYESHKSNNTERRYTVFEKEILVVGHCLRALRQYLLGSPFVVKFDKLPSVTSSANLS
ncbi:polyprotein [Cucumis melo var. makuwa]|uniref:Polyprotein n=1 Tax=Cucumis melo var. makuwa TaxID=1194695 RepID=A0A5D3CQ59_CUCMM|nr:polyprotein [Cucumis melo var. makuwa]